jgi:hypothetical protein
MATRSFSWPNNGCQPGVLGLDFSLSFLLFLVCFLFFVLVLAPLSLARARGER